jgi:hypothetical protein
MENTAGVGTVAGAAAMDPPRDAATAAAAPPPATASATAIHRRVCEAADIFTAVPGLNSEMYWKATVPARACSFEATIRI